jgi:electron transfer flavoprotein alpha subunit
MAPILVWLEVKNNHVQKASLEVLSRGRMISDNLGCELFALVFGGDTSEIRRAISECGAERLYILEIESPDPITSQDRLSCMQRVCDASNPGLILFSSSETTKDLIGALSISLGAATVPDSTSFDWDGSSVSATRPIMTSKRIATVRTAEPPFVISVVPGSYPIKESPRETEIVRLSVGKSADERLCRIEDDSIQEETGADLVDAAIVVAAGRGVRDEGGRKLVEELATTLGAAVGATRAAVELGLFSSNVQIGQTGKSVSPKLYIAIGISGAIQHVAGMLGSQAVVAINRDPDAAIFDYATYGIVGDLFDVLPQLIEQLRIHRQAN